MALAHETPRPSPDKRHRHEIDVEPHAHPGDPRTVIVSDHDTAPHERPESPRPPPGEKAPGDTTAHAA